mgnify:CR=1 FL=1
MGVTSTVFAAVALLTLAVAVVSLVQLHLPAPGVLPLSDPVSDYGTGPYANKYRVQVVFTGGAAAAIWAGLLSADLDGNGSAWLLVFALSRVLISAFPVDLPGAQRTTTGTTHNLLAATAFASIAIAAGTLGGRLATTPAWTFDSAWYRWLGILVTVFAVALGITWGVPSLRRTRFGLIERCWYGAIIAWLASPATGLLLG